MTKPFHSPRLSRNETERLRRSVGFGKAPHNPLRQDFEAAPSDLAPSAASSLAVLALIGAVLWFSASVFADSTPSEGKKCGGAFAGVISLIDAGEGEVNTPEIFKALKHGATFSFQQFKRMQTHGEKTAEYATIKDFSDCYLQGYAQIYNYATGGNDDSPSDHAAAIRAYMMLKARGLL